MMVIDCLIKSNDVAQRVECTNGTITSSNPHLGQLLHMLRTAKLFDSLILQMQDLLHAEANLNRNGAFIMGSLRARVGGVEYGFALAELKGPPDFTWEFTRE